MIMPGRRPELVEHEFIGEPGGELLVAAHGIVGRAARQAVQELRREGRPVNFFRPITLRPFPEEPFREALQLSGGAVLVVESAEGASSGILIRPRRCSGGAAGLPELLPPRGGDYCRRDQGGDF